MVCSSEEKGPLEGKYRAYIHSTNIYSASFSVPSTVLSATNIAMIKAGKTVLKESRFVIESKSTLYNS